MKSPNPSGEDVRVRIRCDVDTAIAVATQYGMPARAFRLEVLTHVLQKPEETSESSPEFGGWFSFVKSANLDGEGEVGIPQNLREEGLGPFDTGMYAAEQAAFAILNHLRRP